MNGLVQFIGVREGLMREVVGFDVPPDGFDVVEFRGILRQPFDGEPVFALGEDLAR